MAWSTEVVVAASAPSIRPLTEPLRGVTALPREGVRLFVVTSEGTFAGRPYAVGEVLVCRGEARSGDLTVLVARGHGRPRLGSVRGTRLVGDAGEPCLPERWQAAGRLVARWRHAAHGWVAELLDPEVEREEGALVPEARPAPPVAARGAAASDGAGAAQLSLFAA